MASTKTIFERSPFYAFIGAADAALENVRNTFDTAAESAIGLRDEFSPEQVQGRFVKTVSDVRDQLAAVPSLATEQYVQVSGSLARAYEEFAQTYLGFAERGVEVTREVTAQSVSAARETGDTAFLAVLDARKEAAKGVERVAGRVSRRADVVESDAATVVRSTAAKEGAAKRPSRKAVAKKAGARKPVAQKAPAKKATPAKKSAAKKTTAKKATPAKRTAASKTTPAKTTAPTLPVQTKTESADA